MNSIPGYILHCSVSLHFHSIDGIGSDGFIFPFLIILIQYGQLFICLVGKWNIGISLLIGSHQLLLYCKLAGFHCRNIKADLQIGRIGSVLHVIHLKLMSGEVLKGIAIKVIIC